MLESRNILLFPSTIILTMAMTACGGSTEPGSQASVEGNGARANDAAESASSGNVAGASPTPQAESTLGRPLAHPEHYYGLYANPDAPNRRWFVTEARRPQYAEQAPEVPPGHLAVGATFGDVAPWQMKTVSDTEFVQAYASGAQPEPVAVTFELDDEGRAVAMTFTNGVLATGGRLERVADLPSDLR